MPRSVNMRGRVKDGRLRDYRGLLDAFEGRDVVIRVSEPPSDPLRRFYWKTVVPIISEHTGYDHQEASDAMKERFFPGQDESIGAMPTGKLQYLIAQITRFAAEGGLRADHEPVIIPDPDPRLRRR